MSRLTARIPTCVTIVLIGTYRKATAASLLEICRFAACWPQNCRQSGENVIIDAVCAKVNVGPPPIR